SIRLLAAGIQCPRQPRAVPAGRRVMANARSVVEHVIVETLARSVITPHFNCLIAKGRPVDVLHGEPVAQQVRGELLGGSDGLAVAGKLAVARPAASEECERL